MIRKAGVPVIPAVVDGSFEAWPKGQQLPARAIPVRVLIGKPMQLDHLKAKEIVAEIDRMFREMLAELRAKDAGPATGVTSIAAFRLGGLHDDPPPARSRGPVGRLRRRRRGEVDVDHGGVISPAAAQEELVLQHRLDVRRQLALETHLAVDRHRHRLAEVDHLVVEVEPQRRDVVRLRLDAVAADECRPERANEFSYTRIGPDPRRSSSRLPLPGLSGW